MRVNVDKTGCNDLSGNINNSLSLGIVSVRQHHQTSVVNTDVARVRRCAGAIDNQPAFEQEIEWSLIDGCIY